jgi:hypothetical protein
MGVFLETQPERLLPPDLWQRLREEQRDYEGRIYALDCAGVFGTRLSGRSAGAQIRLADLRGRSDRSVAIAARRVLRRKKPLFESSRHGILKNFHHLPMHPSSPP